MKKSFAIFSLFVLLLTVVFASPASSYAEPEVSEINYETETDAPLDSEEETEDDIYLEEPPYMWEFTLEDLAVLKLAYEILPEKVFDLYIDYNDTIEGVFDKKTAKRVIDILESTTVVLIDGDLESLPEMLLYVEDAWTSATVDIEKGKRFIHFWYHSPYLYGDEIFEIDNNDPEFVKEITNGDVTAGVYCVDGYYWSMMKVNGTFIKTRALSIGDEQRLEDYEADFARFEFVKIGDLLEDVYSVDSIEETGEVLKNTVSLIASLLKNIIKAFGEYVRLNNGFFIY